MTFEAHLKRHLFLVFVNNGNGQAETDDNEIDGRACCGDRRDPAALATALRRVLAAKIPLQGAADHGVSESIYLSDPDDNGVELYCDKPKELWPRTPDGQLAMFTRRLDLRELLREAPSEIEVDSGPRDL